MAIQKLDNLDKQILRIVSEDARVPFLEVARACNVSGAAIHQRIAKLTSMGVLQGSQFVINPEKCIRCGMCISRCKFGAISVI